MEWPEGVPRWLGKWETWVMFAEGVVIAWLLAGRAFS